MSIFQSIKEFNELAGNTTDRFNARQIGLYIGLCIEELHEVLETVYGNCRDEMNEHRLNDLFFTLRKMDSLMQSFKEGEYDRGITPDIAMDLLDGACDSIVVNTGLALSMGADIEAAMKEVCRSNDSKRDWIPINGGRRYGLKKDANGKIVKGPEYSPPNLVPYLAKE